MRIKYNMNKVFSNTIFILLAIIVFSCKSFKHGYTWDKAVNSYNLVTGNKNNFGDKRLDYNKAFHRNSELSYFLENNSNREWPSFIYEYRSPAKCRGIKLYYVQRDSVFVFEEPKKGNLQSVLKEARKMDGYERESYERLKSGK
jgi:hypothetical protein